ncbi:hypothetical protein V2W30_25900 [Streptomyces sp. Q6]|uniref:Uncharacterized protein n=1 Tax=Streptomyces citrinus TaxID=3118173 RepID=A0ACD5AHQ6_9ACTN
MGAGAGAGAGAGTGAVRYGGCAVDVPWAGVVAGCWTGGASAHGPGSPYGGVL